MVEGLRTMDKVVIPFTPIMDLHHRMARPRLRTAAEQPADRERARLPTVAEQRATAKNWAADPSELIGAYTDSVRQFRSYKNPKEPFLNLRRDGTPNRQRLRKPAPPPIKKTDQLVSWIREQGGFEVDEQSELGLGVDYVEREVSVIRTLNAKWDDGEARGSAGRALQPDLLLRTRDGTPAIGEIKVTQQGRPTKSGAPGQPSADKDPLAALVQALAAVAHLATLAQYQRLTTFFPEARFAEPNHSGPRLDAYLVEYNHGGIPWIQEIADNVRSISEAMTRHPEVSATLRRVVFVELFVEHDSLRSRLHWIAPGPSPVGAGGKLTPLRRLKMHPRGRGRRRPRG